MNEKIAIIDGCRTPFIRSGGAFKELMHWKLGSHAVKGLMAKTGLPSKEVDHVIMGALFHDKRTSNVAREIVLGAGLPESVPAHTCTVACISANMAATNGAGMIAMGAADTVIAGGVEYFDPAKPLPIKEYSTDLLMGQTAERLASRLKISREEQDVFAVQSHQRAVTAQKEGIFHDNIVPVAVPGIGIITSDNGPREDSTIEKISKLKGAFDPEKGAVTAANSSFLTDGAAAVMLMRESKAKALGLKAQAYIRTFAHTAQNPLDELLLGPAFAVPKALAKAGLKLDDIGVLEIHEAFAVQMIANINLLQSADFAKEKLGLPNKIGEIDMDRLNIHGGSLSLGHPFGATGARLIMDCCRRMVNENSQFGLVAGCAAGAVGNAIILEAES